MMIGERLIDLLKDRGLAQTEPSETLFINYRTYGKHKRNETESSDDCKIKLAPYYKGSVDYLLGIIDYQTLYKKMMITAGFQKPSPKQSADN